MKITLRKLFVTLLAAIVLGCSDGGEVRAAVLWSSTGDIAWGPVSSSQGGAANSGFDWHELTNTCSTGTSTDFAHSGTRSIKSTLSNPSDYAAVRNIIFYSGGSQGAPALPGPADNNHRDVWIGGWFYLPYNITKDTDAWNIFQIGGHDSPTDEVAFVVDLYHPGAPPGLAIRVTWWGGNSGNVNMPFANSDNNYYNESQTGPAVSVGEWHQLQMHVVWNTTASSPTVNYDGNVDFYLDGVAWSTGFWNNSAIRPSWMGGYAAWNNYTRAHPSSGSVGDPFSFYWDDLFIAEEQQSFGGPPPPPDVLLPFRITETNWPAFLAALTFADHQAASRRFLAALTATPTLVGAHR